MIAVPKWTVVPSEVVRQEDIIPVTYKILLWRQAESKDATEWDTDK